MSHNYPEIIKENEYQEKISHVCKMLDEIRINKTVKPKPSVALNFEAYINPNATANVIILHGFSEFCQKHRETIWYFYNLGLNVFIYDQRDHGFSCHYTPNSQLLNIERFEEYSEDLEFIINNEISVLAPNLKLYVYSHSMGSAVAMYYSIKNPEGIEKLVLSSPLVTLKTGKIPPFAIKILAKFESKKNGPFSAFPMQGGFNPDVKFCDCSDMSEVRFKEILNLRINNPEFRRSIATNGWMLESGKVKKHICNKKNISKIKADIIMFVAETENTIKKESQLKLAKKLKNCKLIATKNSKHNIFSSGDETLQLYYKTIFDFFCQNN